MNIDGLDDGFCGAIVRYVVFGGESGKAIVGGIAAWVAVTTPDAKWC